jgi:hypothetical protein
MYHSMKDAMTIAATHAETSSSCPPFTNPPVGKRRKGQTAHTEPVTKVGNAPCGKRQRGQTAQASLDGRKNANGRNRSTMTLAEAVTRSATQRTETGRSSASSSPKHESKKVNAKSPTAEPTSQEQDTGRGLKRIPQAAADGMRKVKTWFGRVTHKTTTSAAKDQRLQRIPTTEEKPRVVGKGEEKFQLYLKDRRRLSIVVKGDKVKIRRHRVGEEEYEQVPGGPAAWV